MIRSNDLGYTYTGVFLAGEIVEQLPASPIFYYGQKTIQASLVPWGVYDYIVWSIINLETGAVIGTSPVELNSGAALPPKAFAWKSFGCCFLPKDNGIYAAIAANPPVVVTANEIIYYNSRIGVFDGTAQPVKDCYGFPIDKTYGFCQGASTLVFNESGTIGLAPNIDGDFLIYLAPDYSQFFTSFVLSVETNLRPE